VAIHSVIVIERKNKMRCLYLLSKPLPKPILLGVLTELKEGYGETPGEYRFEYKIKGKEFNLLLMEDLPDINKIYEGDEVRPFINSLVPSPNDKKIDVCLKSANLTEYNEWELLKSKWIPESEGSLVDVLPEKVVVYE
jgi:hypothetical protein